MVNTRSYPPIKRRIGSVIKTAGILLLLGATLPSAWATQLLRVKDNATFSASISALEPTFIAVEGDRIAVLRGVEGAYTYSNDTNQGAVFLKPTEAYQKSSFYVFVTTEQHHNYILLLKPSAALRAGALILKPRVPKTAVTSRWEQDSPYEKTLTALLNSMRRGDSLEGYEIIAVNSKKAQKLGTQLQLRLKTIYAGAQLQGEIYEVANRTNNPVVLQERLFYRAGDRAIALRDFNVAPHNTTLLYKVTGND